MRKVDDRKKEKKIMLFLMATMSLPAVDRPNADRKNQCSVTPLSRPCLPFWAPVGHFGFCKRWVSGPGSTRLVFLLPLVVNSFK